MDGRTYGRTYGRTDGISPHSTGLRPLLGPLPKKAGQRPIAANRVRMSACMGECALTRAWVIECEWMCLCVYELAIHVPRALDYVDQTYSRCLR